MPDYKAAFESASLDLSSIMSLLGFTSYPGIGPMLRAITNLTLAKAEAQALGEEVAVLRARVVVPDGYSLVPVVATDQMVEHVMATGLYHDQNASAVLRDEYRHMVEAAPRLNGKAVSEGLLRRIVTPAITTSDHEDRLDAMNELRTLLGEGTEHE